MSKKTLKGKVKERGLTPFFAFLSVVAKTEIAENTGLFVFMFIN